MDKKKDSIITEEDMIKAKAYLTKAFFLHQCDSILLLAQAENLLELWKHRTKRTIESNKFKVITLDIMGFTEKEASNG